MKYQVLKYDYLRRPTGLTYKIKEYQYSSNKIKRLFEKLLGRFGFYQVIEVPEFEDYVKTITLEFDSIMDAVHTQLYEIRKRNRKPYAIVMSAKSFKEMEDYLLVNLPVSPQFYRTPTQQQLMGMEIIINPYVENTPIILAR